MFFKIGVFLEKIYSKGRMMEKLIWKAFGALALTLIVMGVILFLSAGTLDYWQAWVFLTVFTVAGLVITLYLMEKDPKLLERRMRGGPTAEKQTNQKIIQAITGLGFIGVLVVSALDYRWGWSEISDFVAILGDALIVFGYVIIFFVLKENTFASATIEIASEHKVISTGLYGLVRHPMYMGAFFYLVGIPLALGSWWGLLAIAVIMMALLWRILDEEKFLVNNLSGYSAYKQKVKYRLIPFIW